MEADEKRAEFLTDIMVSSLRKNYLFNKDDYKNDARFKLVLSQEDKDTLFAIVSQTALPVDASELLVNNLRFFRERMTAKTFDPQTLYAGLRKIQVIDTQLIFGEDNAQLIFESMNSKGKPLSPTDLIRNYMLMSLEESEQSRLYASYWHPMEDLFKTSEKPDAEFNAFMWYWLWIKAPETKPAENEVYADFKTFKEEMYGGTAEDLLVELLAYARRYAALFLGKEQHASLKSAFKDINGLNVNIIRPILMVLYEQYDVSRITVEAFERTVRALESFLFRRAVCGRFTTGLNHFFATMYRDISKQPDIETYVAAMLLTHSANMTAYFPTDDYFEEQLASRDCYNRFSRKNYLIEHIENSYHPKQPVNVGPQYQIEHIMPQSIERSTEWQQALGANWEALHDQYCNSLGNLTITGYNPELSNKTFSEKLTDPICGFAKSPYALNDYVKEQRVWGVDQIIERGEILAKKASSIWKYPKVNPEIVESLKTKKGAPRQTGWTIEENHGWFAEGGPCHDLFETLASAIKEDHPDWEMYVTKYYVGFRSGKRRLHLAMIARSGGGGRITLCLAKSIDDLEDPKGLCSDKQSAGGVGPGCPTVANFGRDSDINDIMALIDQC